MEEKDKISTRDIYATFWRCRDIELANLWQRSIFLTAFLVICFSAYGAIMIKIFDDVPNNQIFIVLNFIAFALSIVGAIFSILWIKMGKGSKAWYEVYEHAISAIETDLEYTTIEAKEIGGFGYMNLTNFGRLTQNNSIFSLQAGAYSVSKINIAIGQVFLFLWLLIGVVHLLIGSIVMNCLTNSCYLGIFVAILGLISQFLFAFFFSRSKMFLSPTLLSL